MGVCVCVVPFKQNVKYKTWISGYSAKVDTDNQVPVLSTSAVLTAPMLARCRGKNVRKSQQADLVGSGQWCE